MKFAPLAAAAALAFAAVPGAALAQDAAVAAGTVVYGPEGNTVGTIKSVDGETVLLDTGKHVAPIPANAIGVGETLTLTVTKVQIDQMMDAEVAKRAAARDAVLVDGAAVVDVDGVELGSVSAIDGDTVTLTTADGDINMPRDMFAAEGEALVALTKAETVKETLSAS